MNRLSLNSEGALRTTMHSRTPQARNRTSTKWERKKRAIRIQWLKLISGLALTRGERVIPPVGFAQERLEVVGGAADDDVGWRDERPYEKRDAHEAAEQT